MQCPNCQSTDVTLVRDASRQDEYRCNRCGQLFDALPEDQATDDAPDEDIVDDAGDTDDGL